MAVRRQLCRDQPRRRYCKQAAADRSDRGSSARQPGAPPGRYSSAVRLTGRRGAYRHDHDSRFQRWRKIRRQATGDSGIREAKWPVESCGGVNSPDVPGIGLANLTINPTSPGRRDPIPWKFQYSYDDVMFFWWVSFRVADHRGVGSSTTTSAFLRIVSSPGPPLHPSRHSKSANDLARVVDYKMLIKH